MAIIASELHYRHSGGAGNSDPDASIGGAMSSTQITDDSDNNLFDDVTGDEASSGDTEYRGIYLYTVDSSANVAISVFKPAAASAMSRVSSPDVVFEVNHNLEFERVNEEFALYR